jgi:hypothetical protein
MLNWHQAKTFACHKTTREGTGKRVPRGQESHCAGALIFSEKNGQPGQIHQLASRLGLYDPEKLVGRERVFDNVEQMVLGQQVRELRIGGDHGEG